MREFGLRGIASPHGFRSSFKTWAAAETDFDPIIVEAALGHHQSKLEQGKFRG